MAQRTQMTGLGGAAMVGEWRILAWCAWGPGFNPGTDWGSSSSLFLGWHDPSPQAKSNCEESW